MASIEDPFPSRTLVRRDEDETASEKHVEADDSEYCEIVASHQIQVKTGSETEFDDERPRTAGTCTSGTTDFEDTADGMKLASIMQRGGQLGDAEDCSMIDRPESSFLLRPDDPRLVIDPPSFQFTKPAKQHFDFNGTRKGPTAAMPDAEILADGADGPPRMVAVSDQQTSAHTSNGEVARHTDQLIPLVETRARRKRCKPVPTTVVGDETTVMPTTERSSQPTKPGPGDLRSFHDTDSTAEQSHLDVNQVHGSLEQAAIAGDQCPELQPSGDGTFSGEPNQTHRTTEACDDNEERSSPHIQLQGDLQAAVLEQNRSITANDQYDEGRVALDLDAIQAETFRHASPPSDQDPLSEVQRDRSTANEHRHGSSPPLQEHIPSTANVSKRKSRGKRRTNASAPVPETPHSDDSAADLNDYLQILAYKVQEKRQSSSAKLFQERESYQAELQLLAEGKQTLQDELEAAHQQKTDLTAIVTRQRSKIAAYEAKIGRFKTFVDGLGRDVDSLKKDGGALRRKGELLSADNADRKAEQTALFEQLSACAEKSSQLKNQALEACREAQADLSAAVLHSEYFEQQLKEHVGMLSEARDTRCRLEKQLADASDAHGQLLQAMLKTSNETLRKLNESHDSTARCGAGEEMTVKLEQTLSAVQALASQHSANADDMGSVKNGVETLVHSVEGLCKSVNDNGDGNDPIVSALQTYINDAIQELRIDIGQQGKLMQQDATHRETISVLQEKLEASKFRMTESAALVSTMQERDSEARESNSMLQAKVSALQSNASPMNHAHADLSDAQLELSAKIKSLEIAKSDLARKENDLRVLASANAGLQEQVQALQARLEETQNQLVDVETERVAIESKHKLELEDLCKTLSEHAHKTHVTDRMNLDNALKKITTERDDLHNRIKPISQDLQTAGAEHVKTQKQLASLRADHQRDIDELTKQLEARNQEIKTLQASLRDLQGTMKSDTTLKTQYKMLSAQHAAEKAKHQEKIETRGALAKQVEETQRDLAQAQMNESEAKAHMEERTGILEQQLEEAKATAQKSESGLTHYAKTSQEHAEAEKAKSIKQIEALQQRIVGLQDEVTSKSQELNMFKVDVDKAWSADKEDKDNILKKARSSITKLEAQHAEALAENQRLQTQVHKLSSVSSTPKPRPHSTRKITSDGSVVFASPVPARNAEEGFAVVSSDKENEPPRLSKMNRKANAVSATDPPQALEVGRAFHHDRVVLGPVAKESQPQDLLMPPPKQAVSQRMSLSPSTFPDSKDLVEAALVTTERMPLSGAETQFGRSMPSFATLRRHTSAIQVQKGRDGNSRDAETTSQSVSSVDPQRSSATNGSHGESKPNLQTNVYDFSIFEDQYPTRDNGETKGTQLSTGTQHLQDSLAWSQAEVDKYTHRKPFPNSNSASKLVRRDDVGREDGKNSHSSAISLGTAGGNCHASKKSLMMHSSSPDFIQNPTSSRKLSTYHAPNESDLVGRWRMSNSTSATDPRRMKREKSAPPKRKAEAIITEGYEHTRKKQMNTGLGATPAAKTDRYPLCQTSQPSINDVPSSSSLQSGSQQSRSHHVSSRMRTLAGTPSRPLKGQKKMSKNDEMNARFDAELKR